MADSELLEYIGQYLNDSGLTQTMKELYLETDRVKGITLSSQTNNLQSEFIQSFESGDGDRFFSLWQNHVKVASKQLEILLSVYFAIHPIMSNELDRKMKSMESFKKFLELRREWAQEPEFLQYYALPYLPDPKTHPTFKVLFEDNWKKKLEHDLNAFLKQNLKSESILVELLKQSKSNPIDFQTITKELSIPRQRSTQLIQPQELKTLKQDLKDSTKREHDLLSKLKLLRVDYQKLISVSTELVSTLVKAINQEKVIESNKIDPEYLGDIVKRLGCLKTETPQEKTVEPPTVKSSKEYIKLIRKLIQKSMTTKESIIDNLDFGKIQLELMNTKTDKTLKLLKNIGYFLSFKEHKRKDNLEFLIKQDFLGMNQLTLLPFLLQNPDQKIREYCAKLINCVSAFCIGREYLLKRKGLLIEAVVRAMKVDPLDTSCRQNLLGSLQKLSLRRAAQSMMNQSKMITYLQKILDDLESLSEYSIEYGSALFMNLCLRTQGKKEACMNRTQTLKILNELIDHENIQVKTYVNGCLYSLFADSGMREIAQNNGMESQLQYLKQVADDSLAKQIDFVIEKLTRDEDELSDGESEDGEEEDNDEDDDEDEIFEIDVSDFHELDVDLLNTFLISGDESSVKKLKKVVASDLTIQQLQSMQIQLPDMETTKKGKLNLPISKKEKEEFNFGFSTRPKVPRTPVQ